MLGRQRSIRTVSNAPFEQQMYDYKKRSCHQWWSDVSEAVVRFLRRAIPKEQWHLGQTFKAPMEGKVSIMNAYRRAHTAAVATVHSTQVRQIPIRKAKGSVIRIRNASSEGNDHHKQASSNDSP